MTRFSPPTNAHSLKDAVIVLTGGSSGIGAATLTQLHALGARVVFGDIDATTSEALLASLHNPPTLHFLRCDVRSYADNLALFKLAVEKYGRVDHAIANAGMVEVPGWFDPRGGIEGVEKEPDVVVLDVNLKGVLYFANIACAYLAHGTSKERPEDKSLTLLSSVAGFKETPGLFVYQASKFGVLGLMRALRLYAPVAFNGIRVNTVNPSMTETRMVKGIRQGWIDAGLPVNQPEDVAKVIVGICGAGPGARGLWDDGDSGEKEGRGISAGGMKWDDETAGLNGRALYVFGGECWDIEEGLDRTEHLWIGNAVSKKLTEAQVGLREGKQWIKKLNDS